MSIDADPDHPILEDPWTWELSEFTFHRDLLDWRECYIDMAFVKENKVRRLRFFGPQDLEIRGIPTASGLCILDVSGRQLDGIRVRVACFEQSHGTPTFWASRVIDLDTMK